MSALPQYRLAEAVERGLGDPHEPHSPWSFPYAAEIDETERFPVEALDWAYERELHHQFVPVELGGRFRSFEELAALIRVFSRHDQTAGIAFSTLFWSLSS